MEEIISLTLELSLIFAQFILKFYLKKKGFYIFIIVKEAAFFVFI